MSRTTGGQPPVDPGSGGGYDAGVSGGGSGNGLAAEYGESVGGGFTTKAGYVPAPGSPNPGATVGDPAPVSSPNPAPFPDPVPVPVGGPDPGGEQFPLEPTPEPSPVGGGAGLITDEPPGEAGAGENLLGEGLSEQGGGFGSGSGVFGENGFSDGQLTGGTGTGARVGSMSVGDDEGPGESSSRGVFGGGEEESPESMMGGMGGRGGMGGGSDEELSSSSKYSRGRYFDTDMDEGERSSVSSVRSAYENATDADGNKVDMTGGRRGIARDEDEEEERGRRPAYLKEDEFWNNAQRIVPPVIQ
jgi:hypothetical protein